MALQDSITHNQKSQRFEIDIDGETAYLQYGFHKDSIALIYIFVPESARGKGKSSALIKHVLEFVRGQNKKIIVYCPFIAKYIRLHPEYEDLLDTAYQR